MGIFNWKSPSASEHRDRQSSAGESKVTASQRGVALLHSGRFLEACSAFREAILQEPASASNHVNLAFAIGEVDAEEDVIPHLRIAVVLDPSLFDAHYMLAAALEKIPDFEGSARHYRSALDIRPDFEAAHAGLCRTLALGGDTRASRAAIEAALRMNPQSADFHFYLGNLCMAEANPVAAVASYEHALALLPTASQFHANLGTALQGCGRLPEAIVSFERALSFDPLSVDALAKLGAAFKEQGRPEQALAMLERALLLRPDDPDLLTEVGIAYQVLGRLEPAVMRFRTAVQLRPDLPGGYANLGFALDEAGDAVQAEAVYREGLRILPTPTLHGNIAIVLGRKGVLDEAIYHYRQALLMRPESLTIRSNLASTLWEAGAPHDEVIREYREIVALSPGYLDAHSNLLFRLATDETCTADEYLREARRFGAKMLREPIRPEPVLVALDHRKLRVGFVSGDFRNHPVGFFLEGILRHLDTTKLDLVAYPTLALQDSLTVRIRPYFSRWEPLIGLPNEVAAQLIRSHEIDVLIDLAGHSAGSRLGVFSFRPASVQVSWLGYFASTGVEAIDVVLADLLCVPIGSENQFTERIYRLPDTRLCYTPPQEGSVPEVAALPALVNKHVTFGCFQRMSKVTDEVLALWGRVFEALPEARLMIQSQSLGQPAYIKDTLERLARVGIMQERVTLRGPAHRSLYMGAYGEVDIILDTFPFTGGTTTCEALWMGVPTLTLAGSTMISRQGVSMMTSAGLPGWVASTQEQYVRQAIAFASDVPRLAQLRSHLREAVRASPLFDVRSFARNLESALVDLFSEKALASATGRDEALLPDTNSHL